MNDLNVINTISLALASAALCLLSGVAGCDDEPSAPTGDVTAETASPDAEGTDVDTSDAADEITVDVPAQEISEEVAGADAEADGQSDLDADVADAFDASLDTAGDGDGAAETQEYALTYNPEWAEVLLDVDPYYSDGDPTPDICPSEDWKVEITPEGPLLEINTSFCAWMTLGQPLLVDVPAGATLRLEVRHAEILDGDSDYTLAVRIGDSEIWTETVAVFDLDNIFEFEVAAPMAMSAGDVVYFHLENHGANTWNFVALTAVF